MPSFDHEILVELFRDNGTLCCVARRRAPTHLRRIAVDHARVEPASIDLTGVVPAEYPANTVAVLYGRNGCPATGVIVEVQRKADRDKRLTWPVYVAALHARLDCPAVLLVVAPKPAVDLPAAAAGTERRHAGTVHPSDPCLARLGPRDVELYLSVLVIGELRQGSRGCGAAIRQQRRRWIDWLHELHVDRTLPVDAAIADRWGRLNVPDLVPTIDGMLAATALVHSLTLVTRNTRDVRRTGVRHLDPFS